MDSKHSRIIDATNTRDRIIHLIKDHTVPIEWKGKHFKDVANTLLPKLASNTLEVYLFTISMDNDVLLNAIEKRLRTVLGTGYDYGISIKPSNDEKVFFSSLTLVMMELITPHELPRYSDRRRTTLLGTDLDFDDLTIAIQHFNFNTKHPSLKEMPKVYLHFTVAGTYEGRLVSHAQKKQFNLAWWLVKKAFMIYGPAKYVALAKKVGGVVKLMRTVHGLVKEERINPHVGPDKEKLIESKTVDFLGNNLEEFIESKAIGYASDYAKEKIISKLL